MAKMVAMTTMRIMTTLKTLTAMTTWTTRDNDKLVVAQGARSPSQKPFSSLSQAELIIIEQPFCSAFTY
jgi:hypothetical protein